MEYYVIKRATGDIEITNNYHIARFSIEILKTCETKQEAEAFIDDYYIP
ncbi:MAG: hypothetical protein PF569_03980 [Candidatus Woesearchaeota archaeon]|jgi:hypothetical protein|nr:hypothetical protein [Candidatus Woesearchaeota archaeon]